MLLCQAGCCAAQVAIGIFLKNFTCQALSASGGFALEFELVSVYPSFRYFLRS
jgi:hypothetical protein